MKSYTTEQMVAVLKMYEANNKNLKKTARESGVAKQTIIKWIDKMGVEVFNKNKIQEIVFKADENLADAKNKFDTSVITAKQMMIDKIIERIPATNNMDDLTKGLKVLNELDKDVKDLGVKDGSDVKTINFIQIIKDQLVSTGHIKIGSNEPNTN